MAGDWIKFEENTPDKPEVWQMAAALGIESDAVVGKLIRVWAWAGRNCNADGVTSVTVIPLIDRFSGVTGFTKAMVAVGWLVIEGDNLIFPKFDRHCSQTAKERANTNRRVALHRASRNGDSVTTVTPETLQKPLPEKRREENNTPLPPKGEEAGHGKDLLGQDTPPPDTHPPAKGPLQLRAEALMRRRPTTPLSDSEKRAFKRAKPVIEATTEDDWHALEAYYRAPQEVTFARKDLAALLNNWNGEIDRARAWRAKGGTSATTQTIRVGT